MLGNSAKAARATVNAEKDTTTRQRGAGLLSSRRDGRPKDLFIAAQMDSGHRRQ